ncbi:MAG: hypothetical protein DI536_17595 [Archangium gephyra]|uniref:Uncharacterized protein n=1 Tax=Archangium gephyra TaxID=48 RepID=A0A2W5VM34_9BACT|nr:MAG: hypothetical protein DI536_17595 [Archangium gephyra]
MASVSGKDVVLALMNTGERLERGFAHHAQRLDEMARVAMEMAARTTALETRATQFEIRMNEMTVTVNQLASTVNHLTSTVNHLTSTVNHLTGNVNLMGAEVTRFTKEVGELSADTTRFAELAVTTARGAQETRADLRRLSKLVGTLAGRHGDRLDHIEARVTKLEKKSA